VNGRLDNAIGSFAKWARAPRHRCAVLALLGFIVLAQTALVVHQVEHDAVAHDTHCVLCLAAGHLTGPSAAVQHYAPAAVFDERPSSDVVRPVFGHVELPYLTRAPPALRNTI
jgi:hypothetical protein